jgi:hypothetical protein
MFWLTKERHSCYDCGSRLGRATINGEGGRGLATKLAHVPTELQGLPYEDAPKKPIYEASVIEENSRNFPSTAFHINPSKYNINIFISQPF